MTDAAQKKAKRQKVVPESKDQVSVDEKDSSMEKVMEEEDDQTEELFQVPADEYATYLSWKEREDSSESKLRSVSTGPVRAASTSGTRKAAVCNDTSLGGWYCHSCLQCLPGKRPVGPRGRSGRGYPVGMARSVVPVRPLHSPQ